MVLAVAAALLAGCTDPAPARALPVLKLHVEPRDGTVFAIGEVFGSEGGHVVSPFRYEDATHTLRADVDPEATHLLLVEQKDEPDRLVAGATRATAAPENATLPAILEFRPDGRGFAFQIVQPQVCRAVINANGEIENGTGTFEFPLKAPGQYAVFVLPGGHENCASLRIEAQVLGAWTIVAPED